MKDESGGKIMKEFVVQRPKMYSYIADDDHVEIRLQRVHCKATKTA